MNRLEQLKSLLLDPEQEQLDVLDERISKLEEHGSRIAERLPEAIQQVSDDPKFLASLDKPITTTLHGTIRRDVNSFAEVLFPVIGPAIRRAVADSMKGLVQRINLVMEQTFSVRGIRWRMESMRTGVPVAQIILSNTMLFSVLEVFLIQKETGLLIGRATRTSDLALDEDAVAGMLTAIQSFIQDSFGGDQNEVLRSAELGNRTMWVVTGPTALLACVISGTPPRDLRDVLVENLENIHIRHGDRFDDLAGSHQHDDALEAELDSCLLEELHQTEGKATDSKRIGWMFAGLVVLAVLAYLLWGMYSRDATLKDITATLDGQTGLVVQDARWQDDTLHISGLRDPLAIEPQQALAEAGLSDTKTSYRLQPYFSLDPSLVLQRFRGQTGLAADLQMRVVDNKLLVNSEVTQQQADQISAAVTDNPMLSGAEFSQISIPPLTPEEQLRELLKAPASVQILASADSFSLTGLAPYQWLSGNRERHPAALDRTLDWSRVWPSELSGVRQQADKISNTQLFFSDGTELTDSSKNQLTALASDMQLLADEARLKQVPLAVVITGQTDGAGSAEFNDQLRLQRARSINDELLDRGIAAGFLRLAGAPDAEELQQDGNQRRVIFAVKQLEN